jgi:hypothetical protein
MALLDAVPEDRIFYISLMFEFSQSQDQGFLLATAQRRHLHR